MRINAVRVLALSCCASAISQVVASAPQDAPSRPETDLPNPAEILKKGIEGNNYLWPLLELQRREAEYLASPLKDVYLDYMC